MTNRTQACGERRQGLLEVDQERCTRLREALSAFPRTASISLTARCKSRTHSSGVLRRR